MKKLFWTVALIVTVTFASQSCGPSSGSSEEAADSLAVEEFLEFDTLTFADSLCLESDTATGMEAMVQQRLTVEFLKPDVEGELADSIRAWLAEEIADNYTAYSGENDHQADGAISYQAGKEQDYINAYGSKGMKMMVASVKEGVDEGFLASYQNDFSVSVSVETDSYITFNLSRYLYTGGAHGGYLSWATTFRKSDGHQIGWDLIDSSKYPQFIALVKEELCRYFDFEHEGREPVSEEILMENLQLWDDPETPENELKYGIPLPQTAPSLTRDGLAFVYQQYEIASYACGLPSGVIPFEKLKECLSPEGLELCGLE